MPGQWLLVGCLSHFAGRIRDGNYGSGADLDIKAIRDDWGECKEDFECHLAKLADEQEEEE